MNYAQIRKYDTANGIGIRTSIFFSGCTNNCLGCFNEEYQNFEYGSEFTDNQINQIIEYMKNPYVDGLSVLGGEPFQQDMVKLDEFLAKVKKVYPEKTIWIYSGYTFEELMEDPQKIKVLRNCDVLVDGRFVEKLKNLRLKFRGSENQRLIDVPKSLEISKAVQIDQGQL